jgi:hypothetical protein
MEPIELTEQQHEALSRNGAEPVRAIDPSTNVEYVLLPAEMYERLKFLLREDMPDAAALMNEVMAEDDANDPYLESYQRDVQEARVKHKPERVPDPDTFRL